MYSLIVGEVVNIHIRKDVLLFETKLDGAYDDGGGGKSEAKRAVGVDIRKAKPVARLGYGQEYTVVSEYMK